jgi:predicted metalloprotease
MGVGVGGRLAALDRRRPRRVVTVSGGARGGAAGWRLGSAIAIVIVIVIGML